MAKLFKRGEVYWIRGSRNGKQVRISLRTTSCETAQYKLALFNAGELDLEAPQHQNIITLGELSSFWTIAAHQKRSLTTDIGRFRSLMQHLDPATPIHHLKPVHIEQLRIDLLKRNLKPATVNHHIILLRAACKRAAHNGYRTNPNAFRGIKNLPQHNTRDRICSPEEYETLTEHANPYLRTLIIIAWETGMRAGEIVSLTTADIDHSANLIRLHSSRTKTGQGRVIPLTAAIKAALKAHPVAVGRLFPQGSGSATFSSQFHYAAKRCGIVDLRLHDFRRTFITRLRRAGVDIFTIQKLSGHKTLSVLKRYNPVDVDDLFGAVGKLG